MPGSTKFRDQSACFRVHTTTHAVASTPTLRPPRVGGITPEPRVATPEPRVARPSRSSRAAARRLAAALLWQLFVGGISLGLVLVVGVFRNTLFEGTDAFAQTLAHIREAAGAEQQQNDDDDDEPMDGAERSHNDGLLA